MTEETLLSRALEMRNAIDALEGAMMGCGVFIDLPRIYDSSQDALILAPKIKLGEVRRVCNALSELTRIINLEDYSPCALTGLVREEKS